ncbi:MAG: VOC family protein, partial [Pseudonocardiaceae bacterium]
MPTRTNPWPTGTPCWVDLSVPDLAAAKEFYGAVFGWSFVDSGAEFGHY